MQTWLIVVAAVTVVANVSIVVADLSRARFVVDNVTEVGLSTSWIPVVATLKGAGALGLVVGIAGLVTGLLAAEILGVAAAVGLLLFYTGALVTHVRARVFHNIAYPAAFWLLAAGCVVLTLAS